MSPPSLPLLTPEEIIEFASQISTTRYIAVAGVVFLVYDWLLTLGEEVTSIWPAKWSLTKVVFLVNRYVNIAVQISMIVHFVGIVTVKTHIVCVYLVIGYGVSAFLTLTWVHALVLIRAWVLWNGRPWITISLATAYVVYALVCIALIIDASVQAAYAFIFNFEGTCISFTVPTLWYVWLASLVLEYVLLAFTLTSIYCRYSGMTPGFSGLRPLARRLYISALVYIMFSTACHVFNMVMWGMFWKVPYNMLAITFTCCLQNVAGQRFVLSLRRINSEQRDLCQPELPRFSEISVPASSIEPISSIEGASPSVEPSSRIAVG